MVLACRRPAMGEVIWFLSKGITDVGKGVHHLSLSSRSSGFVLAVTWLFVIVAFTALASVLLARGHYQQISSYLYGAEAPLMNSMVLDVVVRPWQLIWLALAAVALIYGHKRAERRSQKLTINLATIAALAVIYGGLAVLLYSPIPG